MIDLTQEQPLEAVEDDPPAAGSRFRWTAWLTDAPLVAVSTIVTAFVIHARFGYHMGFADQQVLAIRGIAAADDDAFVNDWFNARAPQPHWFFDGVTYVGELFGIRPALYLLYWLASLVAFSIGSVWLARRWLPPHAQWLVVLVGPLLALSPISVLGSTTPLLQLALPHMLGGCLAYACLAALLTSRHWAACVTALAAEIAHVQHGANLAVILFAAACVLPGLTTRWRVSYGAVAMANVVMSVLVTRIRGIVGNGDDFLEICEQVAPFHCYANSWPDKWFTDGRVLALLLVTLVVLRRSDGWRRLGPLIALPAVGLFAGVYADAHDLGELGHMAQRTNIYRLVTLVLPFSVWPLVGAAFWAGRRVWLRVLVAAFVAIIGANWLQGFTGAFEHDRSSAWLTAVGAAGLGVVVSLVPARRPALCRPLMALTAVLLVSLLATDALMWRSPTIGLDGSDPRVIVGRAIEDATPPGSIIAASPAHEWLRIASRRAIVADCKAVPYGGDPWREYQDRIAALGGRDCVGSTAFGALTLSDLVSLRQRFGVTHALLARDDPKRTTAPEAGWRVVLDGTEPESGGFMLIEVPTS